jgi:hypothetical protein
MGYRLVRAETLNTIYLAGARSTKSAPRAVKVVCLAPFSSANVG